MHVSRAWLRVMVLSGLLLGWLSPCAGAQSPVVELLPDDQTGLFEIRVDGAPVVKTQWRAWGPNWRWVSTRVTQALPWSDVPTFQVQWNDWKTTAALQREVDSARVLRWVIDLDCRANVGEIVGAGISFVNAVHSPARQGHDAAPILLPQRMGWEWELTPGQVVRCQFAAPLTQLYFERNQPGECRALFVPNPLSVGRQRLVMTLTLPPGAVIAPSLEQRYGPADPDHWPLQALDPHESFIDLSDLNEKPAGQRGMVHAEGSELRFADGTPARFWGANLQAYTLFMTDRDRIAQHAQRMAQLGFNLARLHHHDSANWVTKNLIAEGDTSQELDPEALDTYFYWIKCLREQGIYVWIDLHVGRPFREGDQIPGWEEIAKNRKSKGAEAKGFTLLNHRLRDLLKQFNEQLLTRVNPYTNLALKDDPAVVGLLLTNENDLTNHFGNSFLPDKKNPHHQELFETRRDEIVEQRELDPKLAWQTWKPGDSKVVLNELEADFYRELIEHLRSIGVQNAIAPGQQWGGNALFGLPALTVGQLLDVHTYTHGEWLSGNPRYVADWPHWIAAAQLADKPLTITEYNNEDNANVLDPFTVPLAMAAFACFQGWDAPMLYGYSQDALNGYSLSFWSSYNHPAVMGLMPAAAVMFRQQHVQPARKTMVLQLTPDQMLRQDLRPTTAAALRTIPEQHRLVIALPATDLLPWLVPTQLPAGNVELLTDPQTDCIPLGEHVVRSDTGQITRDWQQGMQTINTPRSQAAIGWIGGQTLKLDDVTFQLQTPKAAVVLTSLDGQPLTQSQRILLTAVGRVRGFNQGSRGYRSEPIVGSLSLKHTANELTLSPMWNLTATSQPAPQTLARDAKGSFTITLPPPAGTHWWLLEPVR